MVLIHIPLITCSRYQTQIKENAHLVGFGWLIMGNAPPLWFYIVPRWVMAISH